MGIPHRFPTEDVWSLRASKVWGLVCHQSPVGVPRRDGRLWDGSACSSRLCALQRRQDTFAGGFQLPLAGTGLWRTDARDTKLFQARRLRTNGLLDERHPIWEGFVVSLMSPPGGTFRCLFSLSDNLMCNGCKCKCNGFSFHLSLNNCGCKSTVVLN